MSTAAQRPQSTDAIGLIEREIFSAETDRRPISRQMLAEIINSRTGMPIADAFTLVDNYCDEKAPMVPHYLQEEFAIPYLKFLAVVLVLGAIGVYYWGITIYQKHQPAWPQMCGGTIILGFGAMSWVKSLERYAERKAKKQA